ncbi:hypothetical protein DESA109040_10815 [Deinococcus saxicola]|uniref:MFS transporter n=1 Tax=Deinococcus saxicola TaxID=249406 RepID=UPI0039EF9FFF
MTHHILFHLTARQHEIEARMREPAHFPLAHLPPHPLATFHQIRPDLRALLLSLFLVNFGYFMVLPIMAVYLTTQRHFSSGEVGLIMALALGVQKALSLPAGLAADRLGRRGVLLTGLGLRVIGFALFGWGLTFPVVLIAAITSALGGALLGPPVRAQLAEEKDANIRKQLFILRQLVGNLGATLAPLAGGLAALLDVRAGFLVASAMHAFAFTLCLRHVRLASPHPQAVRVAQLAGLVWNRSFLLLLVAILAFLALFSQLNVTLPLRLARLLTAEGHSSQVIQALSGTLLLVNGVVVIGAQLALLRWMGGQAAHRLFQIGVLLTAGGLLLALTIPSLWAVYAGVAVFSIGEVMVFPAIDELVTLFAPRALLATAFGFSSLAWAVGGSVGNYIGPSVAALAPAAWPWVAMLIAALGLGTLWAVIRVQADGVQRQPEQLAGN